MQNRQPKEQGFHEGDGFDSLMKMTLSMAMNSWCGKPSSMENQRVGWVVFVPF